MNITLMKQTKRNNCGQTAIAMVTGKSIPEVEKALGKSGVTYASDLVKVLKAFGVKCPGEFTVIPLTRDWSALPRTAMVRLAYLKQSGGRLSTKAKRVGHFVVWHDGKFYDPNGGKLLEPSQVHTTAVVERFLPIEG